MSRKKTRVRGTWAELIFFCLMLAGFYFILAVLNFPLIGRRGLAHGEYLRSRWGGAVIVIFLFWIYLCFARLMRVRVPRITAQILGTLMLYFALNFIFGLVRYAGLNAGLALFTPSYTGLSLAGFCVLNFGAPGAIIAAVLLLLIAAFLFRSHVIFAAMPYVINFVNKVNDKFNYYEQEDEEVNSKRLTRRERIFEEAQERDKERKEREVKERELELERERLRVAQERERLVREAKAREIKERENIKEINKEMNEEPEQKSELRQLAEEQERVKILEREERLRRDARLKELKAIQEQKAYDASKNAIERRIENKIKSIENLLETPRNYKDDKDIKPQDILGDLLSSLESGAFAVPDKLLQPIDDDVRPEGKRHNLNNLNVESDVNNNDNEPEDLENLDNEEIEDIENEDRELPESVINQGVIIIDTLKNFGINAAVANIVIGSSVIQYQLELSRGVKVDRLPRFANDLAMALAVMSVRIEAPIPGKKFVGI
ncbi:MAG: hypothetical protein IJ667_01365 [Synergistaceae bacterium]|nr:hypothetical protein [Synergistaceae bacterium]